MHDKVREFINGHLLRIEERRVNRHNRESIKAGVRGDLQVTDWLRILTEFEMGCAYCGRPFETLDHIIPVSRGGGTTLTNVAPACRACNESKKASVWLNGRVPDVVIVELTDGIDVYDTRGISPTDYGWLNEQAQRESQGVLWWEMVGVGKGIALEVGSYSERDGVTW